MYPSGRVGVASHTRSSTHGGSAPSIVTGASFGLPPGPKCRSANARAVPRRSPTSDQASVTTPPARRRTMFPSRARQHRTERARSPHPQNAGMRSTPWVTSASALRRAVSIRSSGPISSGGSWSSAASRARTSGWYWALGGRAAMSSRAGVTSPTFAKFAADRNMSV